MGGWQCHLPRTIYETARDTDKLLTALRAEDRIQPGKKQCTIRIDHTRTYQSILGFGGALTEFSAYALSLIPPEKRKEAIDAFYSAETGNRYTLARTHLNSCDFSLENWACVEQADESLESFSLIEEQKKTRYRYLVEGAPRIGAWFPGERYAYNIINDLNHGCMAWIECVFNDFQYGAPYSLDGRVGNMVDCCAFKNTYGSVVLVLMNRSEGDMFYEVFAGGTTANLWCPPRGIQTLVMEG